MKKRTDIPRRGTPILVQFTGDKYPPLIRYSSGKMTPDGRGLYCYPGPVDDGTDGIAFLIWQVLKMGEAHFGN